MFQEIKDLIDYRLKKDLVLQEFSKNFTTFLQIKPDNLYSVVSFLKKDPDIKISILEQIIALPNNSFCWPITGYQDKFGLMYQFKSLKMPYQISLIIYLENDSMFINCIKNLYKAAEFIQKDLHEKHGIEFEEFNP